MIKKFLIYSNRKVYFTSVEPTSIDDNNLKVFALALPIESFWEAQKILERIIFLQSAGEVSAVTNQQLRALFSFCAPFAIDEKNRKILSSYSSHD